MSKEDYERAAAIKRGDGEWPGYDTLKAWIQRTPSTMLPGLLAQVVVCCLSAGVFQSGKLIDFVSRTESKWNEPGHGVLREVQP